jgi:formylglycine-generating enzyme required for sulfatase activity/serine/threonine protein kinase
MGAEPEKSLSDEATFAGHAKRRPASEVSIGDERTLGDNRSGHDTVIDDIEVVDLESRYKVEGTLGQGGMGAVLLATDTRLDRKVAIKRILGEAAGNRMAVHRFLTEAKAIAALNHPNIVQIYDYGRANDGPFLIMEYVDGGSLLDRCRESKLPLDEAIDLACQLCDGLAKAHDLGIIHRDIKPANVLLTKDGTPKLTDFGLAKAQASDHGQTMTGAVLGTPDFMPPEQRRDASLVDHRSDLWSLAATIYQMVTGRSPKIIRFDLLPAELTGALGQALEDEKEARYQSVKEFREALRNANGVGDPRRMRGAAPEQQADLGAGECPKCHIVNDSQRKFCRECAASLRATCLACETPIPVWDKVCPECGKKQPELLAARRATLDQQREEAEALLRGLRYEEAVESADAAQVPNDDRFSDYGIWRDAFITAANAEHATAIADRSSKIGQAKRHRAAFDYPSAIHALEAIPEQLRSSDAKELLDLTRAESDEATRLLDTIRNRIAAKNLDELPPLVQRAIALRGDRQDLPKLMAQLVEREQRIAARDRQQRAWVKTTFDDAWQAFREQGDPKAALKAVSPVEQLLDQEQSKQMAWIRDAIEAEKRLGERLVAVKADGTITTSEVVELAQGLADCLAFMPKNARLLAFREQLLGRIAKAPNEFARHVSELRSFLAALDNSAIQSLPDVLRTPFLASRHLVSCPKCGVGIKPSRLEWHLSHKCPSASGADNEDLSLKSIINADSENLSHTTLQRAGALRSTPVAGIVTNSIGMKFVPIPSGEFLMGSPANAPVGDPREEFQHRVRITNSFFLGMHQVTQAQYEAVMGANPSFFKGKNLPVEHVTWQDAHRFCTFLSSMSAEQQDGRRYRLPTEAEWEYACRAGTTTAYNTGDSLTAKQARFCENEQSLPRPTAPVGSYPANAWGLFDMHGNVWEWTADWFSADYFRQSPVDDPKGPPNGTHHTLRGGSASVLASECYSACRGEASRDKPEKQSMQRYAFIGDFGLRVVCVPADRE